MKKMFTLFVALASFTAIFAQRNMPYNTQPQQENHAVIYNSGRGDNDGYNRGRDNGQYQQNNGYGDNNHGNNNYGNKGYGGRGDDNRNYGRGENDHYNDRQRQEEMNRINRDYDSRIDNYRREHRMGSRDHDRYIDEMQRERNGQLKTFGGGLLLGGVLGVLLGHSL